MKCVGRENERGGVTYIVFIASSFQTGHGHNSPLLGHRCHSRYHASHSSCGSNIQVQAFGISLLSL